MSDEIVRTNRPRLEGLGLAVAFGLALLLLSFVRLAGDMNSMLFRNNVLDSVVAGPIWGTTLGRNIALFIAALTVLHCGLAAVCWLLARLSTFAVPKAAISQRKWVMFWFSVLTAWLLIANAALFPHSSLGEPYAQLVRTPWLGINLFIATTSLVTAGLVCLSIRAALLRMRTSVVRRSHAAAAVVILISVSGAAIVSVTATQSPDASSQKPHIIIIGVDSLRYDATRVDGASTNAPYLDDFLAGSVTFSDAITPLARTFPSWVSIITGRHPHTTGAVVNLLPRDLIHTGDTLGDMLRREGYRTIYGIDEVRFSNLDQSYGFDQIITPPIGASDFLLGWFGDTPLLNLVVNSRLGAFLFPHLHANRGAATTYDPDTFVRRLDRELTFDKPTFLALHLTLVHWPYRWAAAPWQQTESPEARPDEYASAVRRVDQQVRDVMSVLERHGALRNALVIVLSDHGEGLGMPRDFLLPEEHELYDPELALGHGTSVFSPHQYRVVLGMRAFGTKLPPLWPNKVIDAPVTLEDVTPTVADLLGLSVRDSFDGRSLLPLLRERSAAGDSFRDRVRFTETEFNPRKLMSAGGISTSAVASAALFYQVDPVSDRIELRRERIGELLDNRQYAAFLGSRILAAIPGELDQEFRFFTLDRSGNSARRLMAAPDPRGDPELARLWSELSDRFSGWASPLRVSTQP